MALIYSELGAMDSRELLVFLLDDLRYALSLDTVVRVVRIVEITPLPQAPEIVSGVINFQGDVIPVINMRRRFGLKERPEELADHIIIARTARRTVGIVVDAVTAVLNSAAAYTTSASAICTGLKYLDGIITLEDGMVLIHDLDTLLSLAEDSSLEQAMRGRSE